MAISSLCWTIDCNGIFFNNTISYNIYIIKFNKGNNKYICMWAFSRRGYTFAKMNFPA